MVAQPRWDASGCVKTEKRLVSVWHELHRLKWPYAQSHLDCDFDDQPAHPITVMKKEFRRLWFQLYDEGGDPAELLKREAEQLEGLYIQPSNPPNHRSV